MSENPSASAGAADPDATAAPDDVTAGPGRATTNGAGPEPATTNGTDGAGPEPATTFVAPGEFVGVEGPAVFVDEPAAADEAATPVAQTRRVGRLAAIGVAAAVVLAAGAIGTVQLIRSGGGAACLVGSWKISQFPAELGNTGAEMTGGQLVLSFTSNGHGAQTLTNIRVRPTSGPNSVVQGNLTYRYTASDSQITYTEVGGQVIILSDNVQLTEPQSNMAPDTYSCSGNRLTVNTRSSHPEVFTRA